MTGPEGSVLRPPAFVGDDGEKPWPGRAERRPDPVVVSPALERHLLDCVLGRLAFAEHGQGKPVRRLDQWPQDCLERLLVATAGALEQV